MKFDVFYELSVPPFHSRNESAVFFDTLMDLELADLVGFHTAWLKATGVDHVLRAIGAGAVRSEVVKGALQVLAADVYPHFATAAP